MKKFCLFCLILLFIISCNKDCDTIIGTWEWTQSIGGISGAIFTPETTDEVLISFSADSIFREYRNNRLIAESKFTLARAENNKTYLKYQGLIGHFFELQDCENLILTEYASDGFARYFKRKY